MTHTRTPHLSSTTNEHELRIVRVFHAPPELLFRMWTEHEHLTRWCCPKGFTIPFSEGEIRPGGSFRTCMRSPEGEDHWLGGTYLEVTPPERLVFTHAWQDAAGRSDHETQVTVTFEELDGRTRLTLHQARFTSLPSRDGHVEGWQETLDNLEGYLDR